MAKIEIKNPQPSRCPLGPAFRLCGIGRRNKSEPFTPKCRMSISDFLRLKGCKK